MIFIDPPCSKKFNEIYKRLFTPDAIQFLYDLWLFTKDPVNKVPTN